MRVKIQTLSDINVLKRRRKGIDQEQYKTSPPQKISEEEEKSEEKDIETTSIVHLIEKIQEYKKDITDNVIEFIKWKTKNEFDLLNLEKQNMKSNKI